MSTHTLTGTINSGASTGFQTYWGGYYTTTASSKNNYVGKLSGDNMFYACNITFDATTLATLRAKTKTSMKLTVSGSGYLYAQGTTTYWPVRYKKTSYQKTNSATADNTRDPWRSSNAASTADSASNITYLTSLTNSTQSGSFTKTYDISSASVPVYGFCIGPHNNSLTKRMTLSSASLTIVIPDYTVTYKPGANGTGSQTTGTKEYGDTLVLKGAIFTRTGYTQTGWSTTDGGSKAYNLGANYTANSNATLYPYWEIDTYTITYNKGDYGTGSNVTATKTYNVALTLPGITFTRSQYTQSGWSVNSNGSTLDYSLGGSYTNNAAATLYPYWDRNGCVWYMNSNGELQLAPLYYMTENGLVECPLYVMESGGLREL